MKKKINIIPSLDELAKSFKLNFISRVETLKAQQLLSGDINEKTFLNRHIALYMQRAKQTLEDNEFYPFINEINTYMDSFVNGIMKDREFEQMVSINDAYPFEFMNILYEISIELQLMIEQNYLQSLLHKLKMLIEIYIDFLFCKKHDNIAYIEMIERGMESINDFMSMIDSGGIDDDLKLEKRIDSSSNKYNANYSYLKKVDKTFDYKKHIIDSLHPFLKRALNISNFLDENFHARMVFSNEKFLVDGDVPLANTLTVIASLSIAIIFSDVLDAAGESIKNNTKMPELLILLDLFKMPLELANAFIDEVMDVTIENLNIKI